MLDKNQELNVEGGYRFGLMRKGSETIAGGMVPVVASPAFCFMSGNVDYPRKEVNAVEQVLKWFASIK